MKYMANFTENEWNNPNMLAKERDMIRKNIIKDISLIQSVPYSLKCKRPDIFRQIMIMITRHPKYNTERFSNISDIIIRYNAINKKDVEFCAVNHLGINAFSLKVCCRKSIETQDQLQQRGLIDAMRSEIVPQTQVFKKNKSPICDMCKGCFDIDDLDVDHKPPLTFKKLSSIFLDIPQNKQQIPTNFTNSSGVIEGIPHGSQTNAFLKKDVCFKNAWCTFHENNCDLRLLCKPCHRKSGV